MSRAVFLFFIFKGTFGGRSKLWCFFYVSLFRVFFCVGKCTLPWLALFLGGGLFSGFAGFLVIVAKELFLLAILYFGGLEE